MKRLSIAIVVGLFGVGWSLTAVAAEFTAVFPKDVERPWAGPEFWTNPMEDWRIADGRLEVLRPGANRNVHVLTRQLGPQEGTLEMSVRLGRIERGKTPTARHGITIAPAPSAAIRSSARCRSPVSRATRTRPSPTPCWRVTWPNTTRTSCSSPAINSTRAWAATASIARRSTWPC